MNMAQNIFKGLGIALITPFTEAGEVDYKALKRLVEYQIDNGADFFCILATTGEVPCLSREEKDKITDLVKEVNKGRLPILKYCGGNNTAAVVEEIKSTDWSGIDGILSICPYYNKPSQEGLYQHFKAISKVSPLPLVLYNVPGRTSVNLKPETLLRLVKDCDNIVGVKEASGSLEQVDEIIKGKPQRFDVISGDDALTFPMIASGAAGVISVIGNALPKEFSRMLRLEFKGEYEPARKIHHKFTELYKLLFVDGNPAGVKALLNDMGMIENVLRLPLVPTRIETKDKMAEILKGLRI
jgi:4-hydroxy-tetrahydrodipicolinate synthase